MEGLRQEETPTVVKCKQSAVAKVMDCWSSRYLGVRRGADLSHTISAHWRVGGGVHAYIRYSYPNTAVHEARRELPLVMRWGMAWS